MRSFRLGDAKVRPMIQWFLLLTSVVALWAGSGCTTQAAVVDPCQQVDCSQHGKCAVTAGAAICACDEGFYAELLACVPDEIPDPCNGITCAEHGSCAVQDGSPLCICEIGYHAEGLSCVANNPDDPCLGVACSSHGTCNAPDGNASCACDAGYHPVGLACVEDPKDPCLDVACSDHGTCAVDGNGQPTCSCDEGYHPVGLDCLPNDVTQPCDGVTCSGHGTCAVDGNNQPACTCDADYHPEGLACVEDPADPCLNVGCSGHGQCVVNGSAASCLCDDGYHPAGQACLADNISGDRPVWFLHITDCHFGESTTASTLVSTFFEEIVPAISPVASLVTGDTADGGGTLQWMSYVNAAGSAPAYPATIEVPGNHDKKTSDGAPFNTYSYTGKAGAGFYGETLLDSSAGTIQAIRADTADSASNPVNIAGFFGATQATALKSLPASPDVAYSIMVVHHPMIGLEKLRLGADSMQQIIDQVGAMVYFCGHTHRGAIDWLGNTLHVMGPSLGKSTPTTYSLVSIDSSGPNAKLIPLSSNPGWPVAMITQPADAALGGTNPYATTLSAGQAGLIVRAIAFSPSAVSKVEVQVGGGAWLTMDPLGDHVYQASVTGPTGSGQSNIMVRATSGEGTTTDSVKVNVN